MINFLKNKEGVSLMLSYVILIAIAIGMAATIFAWLKLVANVEPVASCEEGTSIIMTDYKCEAGNFKLSVKNNGKFNVSGFILSAGEDSKRVPVIPMIFKGGKSQPGYYFFPEPLKPGGEKIDIEFFSDKIFSIKNIRIQPFILIKKAEVVCSEAVIKQEIKDCRL